MKCQETIREFDAVVVGARASGATTALHLARSGLRVLVADRAVSIGAAFSTHQVNMSAQDCLDAWGIYDRFAALDCGAIQKISYNIGDLNCSLGVPHMGQLKELRYWKRAQFDPLMLEIAQEAGAQIALGWRFEAVERTDGGKHIVTFSTPEGTERVRAPVLVGADGRASGVAQFFEFEKYQVRKRSSQQLFAYYSGGEPTHSMHIWMRTKASANIFPTGNGERCLVLALPPLLPKDVARGKEALLHNAISEMGDLPDMLSHLKQRSKLYWFRGAPSFFRKPYADQVCLVGDAGYFRDPIVGDGIGDALISSELLAGQVMKFFGGASWQHCMQVYHAARDNLFLPSYSRAGLLSSFETDIDALDHDLAKSPRGEMLLQIMINKMLHRARTTRKEGLSEIAALEAADPALNQSEYVPVLAHPDAMP